MQDTSSRTVIRSVSASPRRLPALFLLLVWAVGCAPEPRGGDDDAAGDATASGANGTSGTNGTSADPDEPDPIVTELRMHERSLSSASEDYVQVTRALVAGDLEKAKTEARYMAVTAKSSIAVHRHHAREVPAAIKARVAEHLRGVTDAATRLARAEGTDDARRALEALTDVLVAWREAASALRRSHPHVVPGDGVARLDDEPGSSRGAPLVLIACSESGERWLSRKGEPIANPYSAERRRCGAVVAEH